MIASRIEFNHHTLALSLATGLTTGFGTLLFLYALQRGPTIPIVMITALYPMVTVFLAYLFLHQSLSLKQAAGVLLSLIAIYCLSIP